MPFDNCSCVLRKGSQARKNIIVHAKSAHPMTMKRAIIRNMFKTAREVCSGEAERQESARLAAAIAHENGYVSRNRHRKAGSGISYHFWRLFHKNLVKVSSETTAIRKKSKMDPRSSCMGDFLHTLITLPISPPVRHVNVIQQCAHTQHEQTHQFTGEDTLLLPTQAEERKDDASVKYRICSVPFAPLRMLHDRNPVLGTNSFIKPIRFWWITVLYYVLERIKCYIIHRFGLVALG
ncbi:hypothetical protein Y032_0100g3259 [Ancylostoma ceylanicum]|nr:hypothetical protein Y032_0100g3259 [Ancylostoma ceylanicum]